jgi:hypothetical protein
MPRYTAILLALATLSATALAQSADQAGPENSQSQAAPIQRNAHMNSGGDYAYRASLPAGQDLITTGGTASAQVAPGVHVRIGPNSTLHSIPTEANGVELRLEHGRANVSVQHPSQNTLILVDLPGGQADLVQDGLYTFNAETNTMRVLHGEADAFAGQTSANGKPVKISEAQQYIFNGSRSHAADAGSQLTADLLPWSGARGGNGYATRGDGYYGSGPYGDGYASPYPYNGYGWGYPYYGYGWDYPYWGFGYPFGIGFGFGGFYGGGFYGGGFRGGGFRGGGFGRR